VFALYVGDCDIEVAVTVEVGNRDRAWILAGGIWMGL
jgi:hypothetical protein